MELIYLKLRKKLFLYIELRPISLLSIYRKSTTNSIDDKNSKITAYQLRKFNKFGFLLHGCASCGLICHPPRQLLACLVNTGNKNYKNAKIPAP